MTYIFFDQGVQLSDGWSNIQTKFLPLKTHFHTKWAIC